MKKSRTGSMVSKEWVQETREYFLDFLRATQFPELTRHGGYRWMFAYPEWLIMLIGVLAVKCKEKTYVGIHRLSTRYWKELCGQEVPLPLISESQLRERVKKIGFQPGTGAGYLYQIFPPTYLRERGQRRQDDDPGAWTCLASQATKARHHPERPDRVGHRGDLEL
jgi:hypothetical protein